MAIFSKIKIAQYKKKNPIMVDDLFFNIIQHCFTS